MFAALACAAAHAVLLFTSTWQATGGHFMLPLDDSYIHLQYALRLAGGDFLSYSPGSAPSGGATSPLWVALLAPVFAIGLDGVRGAFAAFLAGGVLYGLGAAWTFQVASRLADRTAGVVAFLLFVTNGHLAWAFFSGMETGLFIVLLLGAVLSLHRWFTGERPGALRAALVMLAAAPLVRPEGILLVGAAVLLGVLRRDRITPLAPWKPALCALPLALWLAVLWAATGDWKPAGLALKGLFSDPEATVWLRVTTVAGTVNAIFTDFYQNRIPDPGYALLKGRATMPYVPPGFLLLGAFGAAWTVAQEWRTRRVGMGTGLVLFWLAGLASVAASRLPFIHEQRYLAPWTAMAVPLAAAGLYQLGGFLAGREQAARGALAAVLVFTSLPSVAFWTIEFGRDASDMYNLHRRMTFALEDWDRDDVLAVSDTGILVYYTGQPHIDVIGLTSRDMTAAAVQGEGAILETIAALPPGAQPRAFATFDSWWSAGFPRGEVLVETRIPRPHIAAGDTLQLRAWPHSLLAAADAPTTLATTIAADLDILDPVSEAAAGYRFTVPAGDQRPDAWPSPNRPAWTGKLPGGVLAAEGTRWVAGEEFSLSVPGGLAPGARLWFRVAPGSPAAPWRRSSRALLAEVGPAGTPPRAVLLDGVDGGWLQGSVPLATEGDVRVRVRSADPDHPGWYSARVWIEVAAQP